MQGYLLDAASEELETFYAKIKEDVGKGKWRIFRLVVQSYCRGNQTYPYFR